MDTAPTQHLRLKEHYRTGAEKAVWARKPESLIGKLHSRYLNIMAAKQDRNSSNTSRHDCSSQNPNPRQRTTGSSGLLGDGEWAIPWDEGLSYHVQVDMPKIIYIEATPKPLGMLYSYIYAFRHICNAKFEIKEKEAMNLRWIGGYIGGVNGWNRKIL